VASPPKALLVLPDVGLSDEQVQGLTEEFRNQIVGTLKKAGARIVEAPIVKVQVSVVP